MANRSNSTPAVLVVALILIIAVTAGIWLASAQTSAPEDSPTPPASAATNSIAQTASPPSRLTGPIHFTPAGRTRDLQVLDRGFFRIGYDNQRKNPAWVCYDLDGPIVHADREPTRPATFATDFQTSAHVSHRDYSNSGYDRGHMCPAFAQWSRHGRDGFEATFIMSNVIPQVHSVNAGIWENLEDNIAGQCRV